MLKSHVKRRRWVWGGGDNGAALQVCLGSVQQSAKRDGCLGEGKNIKSRGESSKPLFYPACSQDGPYLREGSEDMLASFS